MHIIQANYSLAPPKILITVFPTKVFAIAVVASITAVATLSFLAMLFTVGAKSPNDNESESVRVSLGHKLEHLLHYLFYDSLDVQGVSFGCRPGWVELNLAG